MLIKFKIENEEKIYELTFENKEQLSINLQVKNFLDKINYDEIDNRIFYALFNPASSMYMNTYEEIQTCKKIKNLY